MGERKSTAVSVLDEQSCAVIYQNSKAFHRSDELDDEKLHHSLKQKLYFSVLKMDQTHESKPEFLRRQLAVAVRSIQWSYAIFWSFSSTQPGVLEWDDGYYNGDIKTRKTVQSEDCKGDKIGLKRSEQLRELYISLLEGETDKEHDKSLPSDALSPEHLSDAEWYYLVCMSFVFHHAEGLPGRALANCQTIWLCNAQHADSKVFSRSLLAKSASIQTVVCFPYLGGVIELGVTEMVLEDINLLQHVKASLLKFSKPGCIEKPTVDYKTDNDKEPMHGKKGCDSDELMIDSSNECSNMYNQNHQPDDSFVPECVDGGASRVGSGQILDDEFNNGIEISFNSNDCISQEKALFPPMAESVNHAKSSSSRPGENDDIHYKRTLFSVLGNSSRFFGKLTLQHSICRSSFSKWQRDLVETYKPLTQQKLLKKILFTVTLVPAARSLKENKNSSSSNCLSTSTGNIKTRREDKQFMVLRSMVPSISESDKTLILENAIKYLEVLEGRVQELEDCMECVDHDEGDQTMSNNFACNKKQWLNKRKAYDIFDPNHLSGDGRKLRVRVNIKGPEVLIDMQCPYRESILLDVIDAICNMKLDVHFVQSSSLDGVLTLLLKSKVRGQEVAPVWLIKHALWKIANK